MILAAVMLALCTYVFALSMGTSQKYLAWKTARSRAEAAALAAALVLEVPAEGTPPELEPVRMAAASTVGIRLEEIQVRALPERGAVQVMLAGDPPMHARAHQREVANPAAEAQWTLAAPEVEGDNFGLRLGQKYTAQGVAAVEPGRVVAVRVHTGFPKELPLTWIAGRVVASANGAVEIEYLGGYLRGARHGAAQPYGYYEVALGPGGDLPADPQGDNK